MNKLKCFLLIFILAICSQRTVAQSANFVIVHGAWGGSWQFKKTAEELTKLGDQVYRPTLTGLGERYHLADSTIGLETHKKDIINTILFENLQDVILVGHSYGGMIISAVIDSIPERIKKVIYIDALLPDNGESVNELMSHSGFSKLKASSDLPGFIKPFWVKDFTKFPRDVPHPIRTLTDRVSITNLKASIIPATYILTYEEKIENDDFYKFYLRAKARKYKTIEMEADHNPQIKKLKELVTLLHKEK